MRCARPGASAGGAVHSELVVDAVGRDGGRVEFAGVVEAEPFEHLLVLVVARISEDLLEIGVPPGATAIL